MPRIRSVSPYSDFPHHPYREGYSVLPRLRKIPVADLFEHDSAADQAYLTEKRLAAQSQLVCFEHDFSCPLRRVVTRFLVDKYPKQISAEESLEGVCAQIQPDVVVHALDAGRDWLAFAHVCFPSGWRPEEKIGKPLSEIHQPVPGMDLSHSQQLVDTMVNHGPFERFVWSVVFEEQLNFHPDRPRAEFCAERPQLFVKIERQVTVGFPEQGGALFLLRQSLIPVRAIDLPALRNALVQMNSNERKYKGLGSSADEIISWLDSQIGLFRES